MSSRIPSRRGRSRRRVAYSDEDEYDYYAPSTRGTSWSRSSSLEVEPVRRRSRHARSRRRRSPSLEEVRYVEPSDIVERPKLVRRITYVEELPRRSYDERYDTDDGEYTVEHQ